MSNNRKQWTKYELEQKFIPDDFHHLWSILCINPENTVKISSIIRDLKMIRGLYPLEIENITMCVFEILNTSSIDTSKKYIDDYYLHLAYCYLKYGLDGIQIKKKISCLKCDKLEEYVENGGNEGYDIKKKIMSMPCYSKVKFHELKISDFQQYSILYCLKCGIFKKNSPNSNENIDSLGICTTVEKHNMKTTRTLFCPYEEWCYEECEEDE